MLYQFLLLAICAFSAAQPFDSSSVRSNTEQLEVQELTTTTVKPESKVITITSPTELENRSMAGDNLVVIYAMTTWCGHSARIRPTVEDIAATMDNIVVLKIDVDKIGNMTPPGGSWKYGVDGIKAIPTFVFVRNGTVLETYAGSGIKKLTNTVAKYNGSSNSVSDQTT